MVVTNAVNGALAIHLSERMVSVLSRPSWSTGTGSQFGFPPREFTLQVHIVDDVHAGEPNFMPMVEVIAEMLDFPHVVFHWIPPRILTHEYCGAMALAFLGNVLLGSRIPDSLDQVKNMQANMKATFVQALFEGYRCRCPRFWGSGSSVFLTKQLAQELVKHGGP